MAPDSDTSDAPLRFAPARPSSAPLPHYPDSHSAAANWSRLVSRCPCHVPDPEQCLVRPQHGGRDRHVAMGGADLSELITRMEQQGIACTLSQSGRRALFCRDPDGNALEFVEA